MKLNLNDDKRINAQKYFVNSYLIIYSIILIKTFLDTTMVKIPWPQTTTVFLLELAFAFIGTKVLFVDKHSKNEMLIFVLLAVSFLGTFIHTGYAFLAFDLILILGAKNVSFEKLIRLYFIIAGTLLVITIISSQVGLVENLIYLRNGISRNSFGISYPTDLTAHIFYLVLAYSYIRKGKLEYQELAAILGLSAFSYVFCDARTNALCLLLTFAVFLYLKIENNICTKRGSQYLMNSNLRRLLVLSMPICAILFIGLTFAYKYQRSNVLVAAINKTVSGRLNLGSIGLERYGIQLFGSSFSMFGFGGSTTPPEAYFFLDSSFVLILIRYGILVFIAVMIIFVTCSSHAEKQKNTMLLWILTLIAIQSMSEHHLLEIAYNPFLFLVLSETLSGNMNGNGSVK